jgi:hypothetical protein
MQSFPMAFDHLISGCFAECDFGLLWCGCNLQPQNRSADGLPLDTKLDGKSIDIVGGKWEKIAAHYAQVCPERAGFARPFADQSSFNSSRVGLAQGRENTFPMQLRNRKLVAAAPSDQQIADFLGRLFIARGVNSERHFVTARAEVSQWVFDVRAAPVPCRHDCPMIPLSAREELRELPTRRLSVLADSKRFQIDPILVAKKIVEGARFVFDGRLFLQATGSGPRFALDGYRISRMRPFPDLQKRRQQVRNGGHADFGRRSVRRPYVQAPTDVPGTWKHHHSPMTAHVDAGQNISGIPDPIPGGREEIVTAPVIVMAAAGYRMYRQGHVFRAVVEQSFEVCRAAYIPLAVDVDHHGNPGHAPEVHVRPFVIPTPDDGLITRSALFPVLEPRVFAGCRAVPFGAFTFETSWPVSNPIQRNDRDPLNGKERLFKARFVRQGICRGRKGR